MPVMPSLRVITARGDSAPESTRPPPFKHESYREQREHRIAIDTRDDGLEPLPLSIGSIRDITVYARTKSLVEKIGFGSEVIPAN